MRFKGRVATDSSGHSAVPGHSRCDKARFYRIERGSATESAAILHCLLALGLLDVRTVETVELQLQEVVRMLTTLARNFEAPPPPAR